MIVAKRYDVKNLLLFHISFFFSLSMYSEGTNSICGKRAMRSKCTTGIGFIKAFSWISNTDNYFEGENMFISQPWSFSHACVLFHKKRIRKTTFGLILAIMSIIMALSFPHNSWGQPKGGSDQIDLTELSLEDLMNIEVTSVSRRSETVGEAAAAVYVLTDEDIRRSGVTTIPDALRMVPGIQVAQIDGSSWAVTARGFNGTFANKLLVLIDGRSVYTHIYSGVYWDSQDIPLSDIARIEVIRGPGAALWGANAVNGIINIITKSSAETKGLYLNAGGGSQDVYNLVGAVGGAILNNWNYRFSGEGVSRRPNPDLNGNKSINNWNSYRGTLRLDRQWDKTHNMMFQGGLYANDLGKAYQFPSMTSPYQVISRPKIDVKGGHFLSRWAGSTGINSKIALQAYYDSYSRDNDLISFDASTIDLDYQHEWTPGGQWAFMWGLGYRYIRDQIFPNSYTEASPLKGKISLSSAFIQSTFNVIPNKLALTVGSKFEHNSFTGLEIQPSLRALWTPSVNHSLWAAVSRAVRTPSRGEREGQVWLGVIPPRTGENVSDFPIKLLYKGSDSFNSEKLIAYEAGYRSRATKNLTFDIAAYFNDYHDLISGRPLAPIIIVNGASLDITQPVEPYNYRKKTAYGAEAVIDWQPKKQMRLKGCYSFNKADIDKPTANDYQLSSTETDAMGAEHQISLFLETNPAHWCELDLWGRWVDKLAILGVPAYTTLDTRLGLKLTDKLLLQIVGQDLLKKEHSEYISDVFALPTKVVRRANVSLTWSL
jgi:iron complex outermembrane receptor protein